MDKVHMTILGNLEIIGWFEGFNLVKVTTLLIMLFQGVLQYKRPRILEFLDSID